MDHRDRFKRAAALALAVLTCLPAAAQAAPVGDGVTPVYDEAYYATLDYYGNLTEGSVVKSYALNGAVTLTDHGTYDEVVNLTDGTAPRMENGTATFTFPQGKAPDRFYFEGKTRKPFDRLPWKLSLSYTLNGVPARAEDLAGKTGVVEIRMDAVPQSVASEYARHNYTLEAMAMFSQDDILSLEAPGAQVQLIGNLRAVLFVALPGEEQHFTIRVGTDDFSFGGMTVLMVPATLSQLEEIAKLAERKDDLEEDYDALSGSLDTLLDSLSVVGGSLRETADGLEKLEAARDTISSGKGQVYEDGDEVLDALEALEESLGRLPGHLEGGDSAVVDLTTALEDLTDTAVRLKGDLDEVDGCLADLQDDLREIRSDGSATQKDLDRVGADLDRLKASLRATADTLDLLDIQIDGGIVKDDRLKDDPLYQAICDHAKVQGQKLSDVLAQVEVLDSAWTDAAKDAEGKPVKRIGLGRFQAAALVVSGKAAGPEAAQAMLDQVKAVDGAVAQVQAAQPGLSAEQALQFLVTASMLTQAQVSAYQDAKPQLAVMERVYTAVCGGTDQSMSKTQFYTAMLMLNDIQKIQKEAQEKAAAEIAKRVQEEAAKEAAAGRVPDMDAITAAVKAQVTAETEKKIQAEIEVVLAAKDVYAKTAALLADLYEDHGLALPGMLHQLAGLLQDMGKNGLTGDLSRLLLSTDGALDHLGDTAQAARDIIGRVNDILDALEDLDDAVNEHVPGLRDTLRDTKTLVERLRDTVTDSHGFLTSFRDLSRTAGEQLDQGTQESLAGLAESLRRIAVSMDATGDVKSAKDKVSEIVEDTWHDYTGDVNDLLLIDATAEAVSLTSARNPAPQSVQILIRTQEISAGDAEKTEELRPEAQPTTFWQRVSQMLHDFWAAIAGIFGKSA